MTTIEQLVGLTAQHNEIIKRVGNGSLNLVSVKRALQDIIESARSNSFIVERVVYQLAAWSSHGVEITTKHRREILHQAAAFEPVTATDEPLVIGGFGYDSEPGVAISRLFGNIVALDRYTKINNIYESKLRYTPGMEPIGELRLIHYDPSTYVGLSPKQALIKAESDGLRLAGVEVLEHLMLNPQSVSTWGEGSHYFPNISGIQGEYRAAWSRVPYLIRRGSRLTLDLRGATDNVSIRWSSPVVREC